MARDTTDDTPLTSHQELVDYIAGGCKPKESFRIGTEHEKFGFYRHDLTPVPYEGETGIGSILSAMQARLGWEPIIDGGHIIGLAGGSGEGAISIEPGGQFELSGAAFASLHDTAEETRHHLELVAEITQPMGIGFLGMGASPLWSLAETPVMPKSRYAIMTRYMPKVGTSGLDMMYRTSTIQVNLDFSSEEDMCRKLRVSMRLQALATALFAASPFTEGRPNGLLSWRGEIWRDTDNQRAGLLPFVFGKKFGFADYVDWALDVPMYFVMRNGRYHDCTHITFRQFMQGALKGEIEAWQPTMGDWTNHLGTLFPDVRMKRFLEMRGADCGPISHITALSAFWVGLLYDDAALEAADRLTADWDYAAVSAFRSAVPVEGLKARIAGRSAAEIARDVLAISRSGLVSRGRLDAQGRDESCYLEPIEAIAATGISVAETMLSRYAGDWGGRIEPVFTDYRY
ncbi:glutamate--cysteine ligase [Allorhizobium sp. BGMRC 0089]|uniref:glutamate--cysteine ligase n=1 Tax=Allorhizobium sonneratiae TaxID=2934936 RepID=UPI002034A781|nr:glutamate--cysteine ligase [Allorhizobium sonneratiae]MCM2293846.1 glutamate--cysteine ligase [Allorhizobium sonneratiae]